jgi:hypothetical protein
MLDGGWTAGGGAGGGGGDAIGVAVAVVVAVVVVVVLVVVVRAGGEHRRPHLHRVAHQELCSDFPFRLRKLELPLHGSSTAPPLAKNTTRAPLARQRCRGACCGLDRGVQITPRHCGAETARDRPRLSQLASPAALRPFPSATTPGQLQHCSTGHRAREERSVSGN